MSELISGKEALIALANGEDVQASINGFDWKDAIEFGLVYFLNGDAHFRLRPRTITINGIEVPAPFEPKDGDEVYFIDCETSRGYSSDVIGQGCDENWIQFGAWRNEDEIKQVVAALRKIFNDS